MRLWGWTCQGQGHAHDVHTTYVSHSKKKREEEQLNSRMPKEGCAGCQRQLCCHATLNFGGRWNAGRGECSSPPYKKTIIHSQHTLSKESIHTSAYTDRMGRMDTGHKDYRKKTVCAGGGGSTYRTQQSKSLVPPPPTQATTESVLHENKEHAHVFFDHPSLTHRRPKTGFVGCTKSSSRRLANF